MNIEELEKDFARDWDRIRGMMLGLLESFNLDERHERAACSTLKSFTYDRQAAQLTKIKEYLS